MTELNVERKNECHFCDARSGLKILVIRDRVIEFCSHCSGTVKMVNSDTGEEKCLMEIWNDLARDAS